VTLSSHVSRGRESVFQHVAPDRDGASRLVVRIEPACEALSKNAALERERRERRAWHGDANNPDSGLVNGLLGVKLTQAIGDFRVTRERVWFGGNAQFTLLAERPGRPTRPNPGI
jgi:hypothetical protein